MEYFSFETPTGPITCADVECPCPNEPLDAGRAYLFVSNRVVRERRQDPNAPSEAVPLVLCEAWSRRRDLDLEVAGDDAAHWWKTGSVVLRATPRREIKLKEFTGASIEAAERAVRSSIPSGLLATEVVKDAASRASTAKGQTAEDALQAVLGRIPAEAFDREPPKLAQQGGRGAVEVSAPTEYDARQAWRGQTPKGATLDRLECTTPPKKGLLGLGKSAGTWRAHWTAPFIAEASYTMPAVVRATYFP